MRRVAKDQDCSALYVGADFTEYQWYQCPDMNKMQNSFNLGRKIIFLMNSL